MLLYYGKCYSPASLIAWYWRKVKYLFNIVSIYNVYYILHFKITFFIFFYSKPRENVHTLVCRYRHNNQPRLVLSPVKEEEVYRDATMVLFHDMLSDKEMKVIKALATPRVIYYLLFKVGCLLLTSSSLTGDSTSRGWLLWRYLQTRVCTFSRGFE
jgi:hypothetical protein